MITAQDIRDKGFEKSRKVGYDMESVDVFLEEVADSITAYQNENASLKKKMKVLVDKIEEYRANEEALNLAVLSAQKLAVQIEAEARSRSAAMLEDAEKKVQTAIGSIKQQTAVEEKKLADAQAATEKFLEDARSLCSAQLSNLDAIAMGAASRSVKSAAPARDQQETESEEDENLTVRSIEKSVSRIQEEPQVRFDLSSAMNAPSKPRKNLDSTQPFTL